MSLQVWMPLTKDLRNQGLSNVTVTNNGATFNSAGKLGGCYSFNNSAIGIGATNITLGNTFSIACWIKINSYNSDWANAFKIYKDSYDYIGLCMNQTTASTKQLGFHIYKNNGSNARTGVFDAYYMPLTVGTWYHLCFVVTPSEVKTYQNSVSIRTGSITTTFPSVSNYSLSLGKSSLFSGLDCSINDFRLYDHALSQMEIKELSKGLVLHYPLNRGGWGQENLFTQNYWSYGSGWNTKNIINSSTSTVKPIVNADGSCTLTGGDAASSQCYCSNNGNMVTMEPNTTYTISVKITTNGPCDFRIWWYDYDSSGNRLTTMSTPSEVIPSGITKLFTVTRTTVANTAKGYWELNLYGTASTSTCIMHANSLKLEKGSIATPWCPNSSDALATTMGLNGTTEYDCSGFCNNGTRTGTFSWTSDTPRYSVSQYFEDYSRYISCSMGDNWIPDAITMSCWIKGTNKSARGGYHILLNMHSTNFEISITSSSGKARMGYMVGGTRYVSDVGSDILDGKWHMLTSTFNGSTICRYIDGVLVNSENRSGALTAAQTLGIGAFPGGTTYGNTQLYESDVRIYTTALSADDVKSLYQNSAYIDSNGNIYGAVHSEA